MVLGVKYAVLPDPDFSDIVFLYGKKLANEKSLSTMKKCKATFQKCCLRQYRF